MKDSFIKNISYKKISVNCRNFIKRLKKMSFTSLLAQKLVLIHKGTVLMKLKATTLLSLVGSPFVFLGESIINWFHLNIEFVLFVFGAIIIDHLAGSYVHAYIKKDFSIKQNIKGFFIKTTLVILVFFLGRGIVSILGNDNTVALYFKIIMRLMVFIYPAGSALVNISIITNGKFPPIGFMKKLTKFNENMDLSEFKEQENE